MPLFSYSTATRNIHHSIGKAGFCIQRNVRKKVRKKVRNKRDERNERKKYATNVADVVDGTAILITENTVVHNFSSLQLKLCSCVKVKLPILTFATVLLRLFFQQRAEVRVKTQTEQVACCLLARSRKTEQVATLERLINISTLSIK